MSELTQQDMNEMPLLMPLAEVAKVLGCHRGTVYYRMHNGTLGFPVLHLGGSAHRVPLLVMLEYGQFDLSNYHARIEALPRYMTTQRVAEEVKVGRSGVLHSPNFPLKAVTTRRGSRFRKEDLIALLDTHKSCHAGDSCSEGDEHVSRRIRRSA